MKFTIIDKKAVTEGGSIELQSVMHLIKNRDNVTIIDFIEVGPTLVGRLDRLSEFYYGNTDDLEIILKFNQIGNMFAVPIGKILAIPEKESFYANVVVKNFNISIRKTQAMSPNNNAAASAKNVRSSIKSRTNKTFNNNNGTLTI